MVDRNQRLIYRKTQFRDQLVHHNNPDVKDNFCEYRLKTNKDKIKETAPHMLLTL